jgi:DNA polymerase III delta subunit
MPPTSSQNPHSSKNPLSSENPLSPDKLFARLARGDLQSVPAVLLLGGDSYLRDACRTRLLEISVEPAAREWGVCRFSAATELSVALGQAQTMPMLARRQVVIIRDLEALEHFPDDHRDAAVASITAYLADPAPFTLLILEAAALDQRMKLAKILFEKVLVVTAELPADPRQRAHAAVILAQHMARERDTTLDAAAADELVDLCNADLAAIHSEIAKLATHAGPGQTISRANIAALVVSEKKHSVWELADMLASQQRAAVFAFLDHLLREGEPGPALVGAMAWMFRKLLEAQELAPHTSKFQAAQRLGMRADTAELALRQSRKIPRRQLVAGLRALYEADNQIKLGADDRLVLEFLAARLTKIDRIPPSQSPPPKPAKSWRR